MGPACGTNTVLGLPKSTQGHKPLHAAGVTQANIVGCWLGSRNTYLSHGRVGGQRKMYRVSFETHSCEQPSSTLPPHSSQPPVSSCCLSQRSNPGRRGKTSTALRGFYKEMGKLRHGDVLKVMPGVNLKCLESLGLGYPLSSPSFS